MSYGRGHRRGPKKVRPSRTPEFDARQAFWLTQIEQAMLASQAKPQPASAKKPVA